MEEVETIEEEYEEEEEDDDDDDDDDDGTKRPLNDLADIDPTCLPQKYLI